MEKQTLTAASSSKVEIYNFGAHITSWQNSAGREMIYTSPTAILTGQKAIRGGIPICFPQFAKKGPLRQHGFARNMHWTLHSVTQSSASFVLEDDETTRASEWPHRFSAKYCVVLADDGDSLNVTLDVENKNEREPFSFTTALHSYFACEAETTTLPGFDGGSYEDSIDAEDPGKVKVQRGDIGFGKEVDRVYLGTGDALSIPSAGLTLEKSNLPDAVVWNPYVEKAAALADMPDDGWKEFVCIEPARVNEPAVVQAGETWSCSLTLVAKS